MYRVTKLIDFSYGHRLLDYEGPCQWLHGHNGRAELELAGPELDHRGMLVDFADIKSLLSSWIDENLDHRMILRRDDPAIEWMREQGEPIYIIDHNPTAEVIARILFEKAREFGLPVVRVTMWETPSSRAIYEP